MVKEDYEPFGTEWIAEMKKHSKDVLIALLSNSYKKILSLEDNRGWIKIESKDDFPKFDNHLKFDLGIMNENGTFVIERRHVGVTTLVKGFYHRGITHYKDATQQPPIY